MLDCSWLMAQGSWTRRADLFPLSHEPFTIKHASSIKHQASSIKHHQAMSRLGIGARSSENAEVQLTAGGRQVAQTVPVIGAQ